MGTTRRLACVNFFLSSAVMTIVVLVLEAFGGKLEFALSATALVLPLLIWHMSELVSLELLPDVGLIDAATKATFVPVGADVPPLAVFNTPLPMGPIVASLTLKMRIFVEENSHSGKRSKESLY